MNKLSTSERVRVVSALLKGNSVRSVFERTGTHRNTILKLLEDLGAACLEYQGAVLQSLPCKNLQWEEIWSFYCATEVDASAEMLENSVSDCWTWVALCADTKLVPCWLVGERNAKCALEFMQDLAGRLANRTELTVDEQRARLTAIQAPENSIDYNILVKIYGSEDEAADIRYITDQCSRSRDWAISRNWDKRHTFTSYVERPGLTMRTHQRRFTRLTDGSSRKLAKHELSIALHYLDYNFRRIHPALRVTPAMEAGIADHVWCVEEIVALMDAKSNCSAYAGEVGRS